MTVCAILLMKFLKARYECDGPAIVIEGTATNEDGFEYPWNPDDWDFVS